MNNERITLTMKEQRINYIMVKLISKEITMSEAIRLTGLSERQLLIVNTKIKTDFFVSFFFL